MNPSKAMTAAERQRKRRAKIKRDKEMHDEYLKKERERWKQRKEEKKTHAIANMSTRDRRRKRKYWRDKKAEAKSKATAAENIPSPPATPPPRVENQPQAETHQAKVGRKKKKKEKSKCYRELWKLRVQFQKMERQKEKYRKRYERLKKESNSPSKYLTDMLSGSPKVRPKVKRNLLLHRTVMKSIREKYAQAKTQQQKQIIRDIFFHNSLKKYRLGRILHSWTGIKPQPSSRRIGHERKTRSTVIAEKLKSRVLDFLESDINSRITTNKADTVTRHGLKRQRRILTDSMKILHTKYLAEHEKRKHMGYALFCKLRPFHITPPKSRDRDTCLCVKHENSFFMFCKLKKCSYIPAEYKSVKDCISALLCPAPSSECHERKCRACKDLTLQHSANDEEDWWWEWSYTEDVLQIAGGTKKVRKLVKKRREGTLEQLFCLFESHLKTTMISHEWRITHQFLAMKHVKEQAGDDVAVLVVDFSENYQCKYFRAPQSTHFGASQQQATLHTGVAYIQEKATSFCSVSSSLRHDPAAIWAHLQPVVKYVLQENPTVKVLHVFSDGPTTQYRNKKNFAILGNFNDLLGQDVTLMTWNMFEAGHGKGPADAIGGVVKRQADMIVNNGTDIADAAALFDVLSRSSLKTKLFYVTQTEIEAVERKIPDRIETLKGTMNLHQLVSKGDSILKVRNVSCFCDRFLQCDCYQVRPVQFPRLVATRPHDILAGVNSITSPDVTVEETTSLPGSPLSESTTCVRYQIDQFVEGKWCIARYKFDGKLYPGLILNVDDDAVQIEALHPIGVNKFVKPKAKDITWYSYEDVIAFIDEPQKTSSCARFFVVKDGDNYFKQDI